MKHCNTEDNRRSMRRLVGRGLFALLLGASPLVLAESQPLVDVEWIKANSCNEDVRVLDIRNGLDGGSRTDYLRGHIPCAVYTDYLKDGWRAKDKNGVPGQLAPVDKLEKLIGGLGIGKDTHVVIAPAGKNALDMGSATRMYWTFKVLGHDNVSILNGGLAAYTKDEKNPLAKGNEQPEAQTFTAEVREEMIVDKDDVKAAIEKGTVIVDNRPHDQYVGINRHPKAARNGTIPGAENLPENWLTENNGGSFRDVATLKQLYALAEVPTQGDQINFCNTGHWASLGWFASHELLGNKDAKVYDGSLVEWTQDESAPLEQKIKLQ
ncbi:sulfurtransferase [Thiorhodococcus mannitoliphagus]|uniref:Sulfurtransferase n=1 Tax=Thiorhodococcus mannitoliphagus TaxID=329406 RepID=A0A6P1E1S3_9GAMM|nr:sulfurtransferase [Thiorhodococcus mannitoliphagus]NEX22452.1 sulfurtransferase [Thiorhodococcus mannitoliphagus]